MFFAVIQTLDLWVYTSMVAQPPQIKHCQMNQSFRTPKGCHAVMLHSRQGRKAILITVPRFSQSAGQEFALSLPAA
jgi:hypothetical protein